MLQRTVCRDVPLAFGITGVLVIGVATAALIAFGSRGFQLHIIEMSTGVLLLVCAQLFALRPFRPATVTWSWGIACLVIVILSIVRTAYLDSPYPLTFAYIIMTAFAPVMLFWRPSIAAGLAMLAALVVSSQLSPGRDDIRVVIGGVTALLVGAMLLRLRLKAIAEWCREKTQSEELVTTDVLTGTLTARGLLTVVPAIASIAERTGEQVLLIDIRIPDLSKVNSQYGARYGDDVLRAVAKTIHKTLRRGDLVARWQGAEFVIAGIGRNPNANELAQRVQNALHESGVNLGKWPMRLTVGTAAGDPREVTFDELLTEARARRQLSEAG
jgi:diguanylate cyclase (GGDEF)-like protein